MRRPYQRDHRAPLGRRRSAVAARAAALGSWRGIAPPHRGRRRVATAAASEGGQVPIIGGSVGCDRGVTCPLKRDQVLSIGG